LLKSLGIPTKIDGDSDRFETIDRLLHCSTTYYDACAPCFPGREYDRN
jgi:hypothetical protein